MMHCRRATVFNMTLTASSVASGGYLTALTAPRSLVHPDASGRRGEELLRLPPPRACQAGPWLHNADLQETLRMAAQTTYHKACM